MKNQRPQWHSVPSNAAVGPVRFIPGGELVYSKQPARPKLWKEPPNRGIDGEIQLVNTDMTVLPDLIAKKDEVFADSQQAETIQSSTGRRIANMIGSGRFVFANSRMDAELISQSIFNLHVNSSVLRGIADSAFYAGEFSTSSRYLDQLHQRNRGTVHTYLLQTETSIYLGKPTSVIIQQLERFCLEMATLMAKLSATHSRYIRKHMPEISLYHMLRWAVELGRNNRLYGAIFVCRSLSLLPALHRNRVRQFDLTYGLFIEIALRIMNVLHQDGIALGNVLIECLDSAFRMLLDRAQVLHPLASAFEWNRLVACSNTVAFLSNITGDYDKVSRRVKWGLNAIAKYLHPRTILYADLKVNEAVMCLKTWRFEAAVRCYEEASRVYRSCVELDSHRMEMVERARRALALAKKLRDVKEETPRSKKVYSLSQCPRHIAFHKNHKTKSAHQLLGQ